MNDISERSRIAVVIPTVAIDSLLHAQLDALEGQVGAPPFEIIVSCNRSDAYCDGLKQLHARNVRVVDGSDVVGPSYARNTGWKAATNAEVILFCDSDDIVSPEWVAMLTEATKRTGIATGPLNWQTLRPPHVRPIEVPTRLITEPKRPFGFLPFGPTSNLGISRNLLVKLDGFDENLETAEDVDLCWRAALSHGAKMGFEPRAVVDYRPPSSTFHGFLKSRRYGLGERQLLGKFRDHPVGRGPMWWLDQLVRLGAAMLRAIVTLNFDDARFWRRLGNLIGNLGPARYTARIANNDGIDA